MRLHGDLFLDSELAVVEGLQRPAGTAAGPETHAADSCSTSRNARRARVRRDLTVPSVTPSE